VTSVKLLRKEKRTVVGGDGSRVLVHEKMMAFLVGQEQEPAAACCHKGLHTTQITTQHNNKLQYVVIYLLILM